MRSDNLRDLSIHLVKRLEMRTYVCYLCLDRADDFLIECYILILISTSYYIDLHLDAFLLTSWILSKGLMNSHWLNLIWNQSALHEGHLIQIPRLKALKLG